MDKGRLFVLEKGEEKGFNETKKLRQVALWSDKRFRRQAFEDGGV